MTRCSKLASLGAKVLQIRSVEFAKRYQVPVHVRSSFSPDEGTWLLPEDQSMEEVTVSGVTSDLDQAKITLMRVARPARPWPPSCSRPLRKTTSSWI